MGSSLVTAPVRPVSDGPMPSFPPSGNLPAVRHPVQQTTTHPRFEVSEIATHDGELAQALHARLDFSKVVNNGCSLTAADAYAVLAPSEFARFEVISSALKSAKSHESAFNSFALGTGAAVALGATSLALFSGISGFSQVLIDVVASLFAFLLVAAAADGAHKAAKEAIAEIPTKLAALPAPQKQIPADPVAKAD